jgi:uncharacterized short protein YbdD (DUF466 family)
MNGFESLLNFFQQNNPTAPNMTEEEKARYDQAMLASGKLQQIAQPMNTGLLNLQTGGGIMPVQEPELESTQEKMQGLLDLLAMIKGPQG